MNILTDPGGKKYDLSDHKRVIYTDWWSKDDAIANTSKEFHPAIKNLKPFGRTFMGTFNRMIGKYSDYATDKDTFEKTGRYRLIEMWRLENVKRTFYYDPFTGDQFPEPEGERELAQLLFKHPDVIKRTFRKPQLHVTVTLANEIVLFDGKARIQNGMYPFVPFYPYYVNGDVVGMVHNLKSYQDEHNKRSSAIIHILMSTANSGWMTQRGSVDREELERDGTGLGGIIEYEGVPPQKIIPNQVPTGLFSADQEAKQGIYETSGIGPNLMGRAENSRESGKLFNSRVDEGHMMLQPVFQNYARTKELLAKQMIWYYQNLFKSERVFTIIDEQRRPERVEINKQMADTIVNDLSLGMYDVEVESVAKAATIRAQTQGQLSVLAKSIPAELVPWHEIVRMSDIPPEPKERMAQYIESRLGIASEATDAAAAGAQDNNLAQVLGALQS